MYNSISSSASVRPICSEVNHAECALIGSSGLGVRTLGRIALSEHVTGRHRIVVVLQGAFKVRDSQIVAPHLLVEQPRTIICGATFGPGPYSLVIQVKRCAEVARALRLCGFVYPALDFGRVFVELDQACTGGRHCFASGVLAVVERYCARSSRLCAA